MRRSSLIADRTGSADIIQFILVLPVLILLLYGSFEVWKIVSVKQSLGAAAYQAARCRSVYNRYSGVTGISDDNFNCEKVLLNDLADNSFVDWDDLADIEIRYRNESGDLICVVAVNRYGQLTIRACPEDPTLLWRNEKFDVEAVLPLPWPLLMLSLPSEGGEGATTPALVARHRTYIEAGPRWRPTPTPTPLP